MVQPVFPSSSASSSSGPGQGPPANPKRKPRRDEWTRAKMVAFLRELAASQSVTQASRSVGMSRQSAYRLRNRKEGTPFALAWEVALEAGLQQLAHAVLDRAVNGEEVPHYYHGELVGTHRKYDNRLAAWVLDNPWKIGRHQLARESAARDWAFLLDQVEFGSDTELEPGAAAQAEIEAAMTEEERAAWADPLQRMAIESWYMGNLPSAGRRAGR